MLLNILRSYRELPRNIHLLFLLEFSLSLIHVAFILILNIYLRKQGFTDPEIASFNSLRFIGALAFALPLGIYIRGKRLKPFFKLAAVMVPITSAMIIESIHFSIVPLIQLSFLCWGVGMMLMRKFVPCHSLYEIPQQIIAQRPYRSVRRPGPWLQYFPALL